MNTHFISKFEIKNLQNVSKQNFSWSNGRNNSLIITGRNGSGKTTLLNEISDYFINYSNGIHGVIQSHIPAIKNTLNTIERLESKLKSEIVESEISRIKDEIATHKKNIESFQHPLKFLERMELQISSPGTLDTDLKDGKFVFVFLPAKRESSFQKPEAVKPNKYKKNYIHDKRSNSMFVSTLVNLWTEKLYAKEDRDEEKVKEIETWFDTFEIQLREIFQDDSLELKFNRKELNFYIQLKGKSFDFNQLSAGYSSVLDVVSELLIRLNDNEKPSYLKPGTVLIDEVENHLHMELQRKIVPFLMSLFPNIQFIVSTHSPFVLHSVDEVDIFDLENGKHWKNLAAYSAENIITNYFDVNLNSDIVLSNLALMKEIYQRSDFTNPKFDSLRTFFEKIDMSINPEVAVAVQALRISQFASSAELEFKDNGSQRKFEAKKKSEPAKSSEKKNKK